MDAAQILGIVIGLGIVALIALVVFIKAHIVICQPNEIVVISGRTRDAGDGQSVGYRVIRGGRSFRWPIIESVARLPLTATPLEVHLPSAMSAGMIPVEVEGRANIKLAGRPEDGMEAAIERFLGKGTEPVVRSAQQIVEGVLRGSVATFSAEDANARRLELADQVAERARSEMRRLGIVLDFFQIQSISDREGYLEAIGRRRNAEVQRDARIAEAEANANARLVSAEQNRIGRDAEVQAERAIIQQEQLLAVERADLQAQTNRAEQKAAVAGDIARVEEQVGLEERRIDHATKREQADTVIPAQARSEAMLLEARGKAGRILEDGRATAEAIELMRAQWQEGDNKDLFLIQLLPELLDKVTRVVAENLHVDKLTVLDGGDGKGLPNYVNNLANSAVVMLEQMKNATGLDLSALADGDGNRKGADLPKDLG